MRFRDLHGHERDESLALGPIVYEWTNVRVRRMGLVGDDYDLMILEWYDGARWLRITSFDDRMEDHAHKRAWSLGLALRGEDEYLRGNR
jgi:hypothetical protein